MILKKGWHLFGKGFNNMEKYDGKGFTKTVLEERGDLPGLSSEAPLFVAVDHFSIALFSALQQTHCARM